MPMATYSELLKDPKWQKRRLEILQRDDFQCQYCGNKEETIHIHHIKYFSGMKPWEYHGNYLITLCETCHGIEERRKKEAFNGQDSLLRLELDNFIGEFICASWEVKSRYKLYTSIIEFIKKYKEE